MRFFASLFVLLSSAVAIAGEPVIVLLPDGTAWFSAGAESPTILVRNIIRAPGMPPGGNPPDEPAPPDEKSGLRKDVAKWSSDIDDTTGALVMSRAYGLLGEYIASGKIPADADSIDKAITAAGAQTFKMLPGKHVDDWEELHRKVMDKLTVLVTANGGKLTAVQWSGFFREVSAGLDDSTSGSAIPPWLEPLIAALVQVLIDLLSDMFK